MKLITRIEKIISMVQRPASIENGNLGMYKDAIMRYRADILKECLKLRADIKVK